MAEVVTTDLVMRTGPAVSPQSVIYPERLGPGDLLYLVDGPVTADGYDWFLVDAIDVAAGGDEWVRLGWVAAADKSGEPWIVAAKAAELPCSSEMTLEAIQELPAVLRLACYGAHPLSLQGDVTCPTFHPPIPTPSPAWLTWDACHLNPSGAPPFSQLAGLESGIWIHYPPGDERLTGSLTVTGHFYDPISDDCTFDLPVEDGDVYTQNLAHREQQLRCRASFVVDIVSAAP